jgi:hypothetical protein
MSLADRAVLATRARAVVTNATAEDRRWHDRAARTARTLAAQLGVDPVHVSARCDPAHATGCPYAVPAE